ncbi:hypothetical protein ACHAXA_006266 [Cyclostephanos tholiformis]|uniref:Uncharacterized protein n=1 Tax=Cyclostephanos tholiformis TaxID=382380 RepID=A0ABD3SP33_9STRA
MAKSEGRSGERRFEGHNMDELYGIVEDRGITTTVDTNDNETDVDDDDIVSVESDADDVTLRERMDSRLYVVRETRSGRRLWKCPLEESDKVVDHIAAAEKSRRGESCRSFRGMLPPLDDGPPMRSPGWLRRCSGGTLRSYLEHRLSGNENRLYRIRFPEHVYCWFADDDKGKTADQDRWAFYHGLMLEDDDPERWLTRCLLDDTQGEDFSTFLAHLIRTVQDQTGKSLDELFGKISKYNSRLHQCGSVLDCDDSFDQTCTAENAWIPTSTAQAIVRQLFQSDWIDSSKFFQELFADVTQAANHSLLEAGDGVASRHELVAADESSIGFFAFLQLIMKTHLSRRKKQLTLIELLFEKASKGVVDDFYDANKDDLPYYEANLISVRQLYDILKIIWPSMTLEDTTLVFREAYGALYPPSKWTKTAPTGINFQSFLIAAERLALFSTSTCCVER